MSKTSYHRHISVYGNLVPPVTFPYFLRIFQESSLPPMPETSNRHHVISPLQSEVTLEQRKSLYLNGHKKKVFKLWLQILIDLKSHSFIAILCYIAPHREE